ncbi:MAG: hypothetical protein K9M45_02820 [Kiritimatiellales bacterium]|nr:hypothetical protein [Kiritimatiellales bacterium]
MTHCPFMKTAQLFFLSTGMVLSGTLLPAGPTELPAEITGASGRAYVVYVESMPGETWDEKIEEAMRRALAQGGAAEVILPPETIEITRPIRFWRLRRNRAEGIDTHADGVAFADIRNVWAAMQGGAVQDLARGLHLRGQSTATTRLVWAGDPDQVVIDIPAPYGVRVSNLAIDGNNTEGLIGIRYRAGWEFGVNGGKRNDFDQLEITRVDVGIHVGGPFGPDLVGSTFRQILVQSSRIGFLLEGANVAEMHFNECFLVHLEEAGFKLVGHGGRELRSLEQKDDPMPERPTVDYAGRELFHEQMPERLVNDKVHTRPHPDVNVGEDAMWVGGGGPSITVRQLVAAMGDPRGWLFDSNGSNFRIENVRKEGSGGLLRVQADFRRQSVRFNDILIDINATTEGGPTGNTIEYEGKGPLYIIGGTFEGPIALGDDTVVYSMGARFLHRQRTMRGFVKAGAELPASGFWSRTGQTRVVPFRRWEGDIWQSRKHDSIGFVQLPGTAGAQIHELKQGTEKSVSVRPGEHSVRVGLESMERQQDGNYQVLATPQWNAGGVWVDEVEPDGFTVRFERAPEQGARLDVITRRKGFTGWNE